MAEREIGGKHLPLTEATYYIMLALEAPLHGYGVMQKVEQMSEGVVRVGPGTLYGAFSTLEREGLIAMVDEQERRKSYLLTEKGKQVLREQLHRLEVMVRNGRRITEARPAMAKHGAATGLEVA
jgi:DNA-binding PadR family transcriptional regulator